MKRICDFVLILAVIATATCIHDRSWAQTEEDRAIGPVPPGIVYPDGEAQRRFDDLASNLKARNTINGHRAQTFHDQALILDSDRDPLDIVLRRTGALLADISGLPKAPKMTSMARELADLKKDADAIEVANAEARRAIFDQTCRLRRRIAFSNPLLDFDEILILKRRLQVFEHMCDQYYGVHGKVGGGIYVLSDPFGSKPQIHDILASSVVQRGRLKGRKLSGTGSFLSPDLSFDGENVAFAYVECEGPGKHDFHLEHFRGHWDRGRSFHIFKSKIDGSGLEQLTDGTFNDFDPCWMPSGRIAFITERRGGYLRCGRACPTYTLYDMAADGSDISCLSYHETNEWHPSVKHDGMIVWTRWDYVDRHGQVAHMPWTTTPDGRDPRAIHGNYAVRRKRPDMETNLRAIPGSQKIVGVASPHHGQSFGSMIIIDPSVEDDDMAAPLKRLTPEVGFPESQTNKRQDADYGQPWPLSENYYLCAYEPKGGSAGSRKYGIYLVDVFGNKELIYKDPSIASQSPIPVKRRPTPPVLPEMSKRLAKNPPKDATVGVINVYLSRTPFPEGTKITALRIYQIFPLSIASQKVTHSTGFQCPQGTDSINLTRAVIGTVPVEKDGSAHFIVPAGKEMFFQLLDEDGLAVTSMRSGTHFQPGERMMCQGCHEPRYGAPTTPAKSSPLAMQRAPSRPKPDVDGTSPFSYPRLVQPVLDKHCVKCHAEDKTKKAPRLDSEVVKSGRSTYMNPNTAYYASYLSLMPEFGFYNYGGKNWDDPKWYRTTPGEFGARASKLYQMLKKGHHKLKLPPDDMHRITVWLDSCSPFYGVYEKEGGELQLRGEVAMPTLQ